MKFEIHRFETCSSTNDVAKEMALRGAPEGTVVVADEQTAGRGTKGRSWHSPKGKGLSLSVVLRPASAKLSLLPLAAGLAVREAVERSHGLSAWLRWPNDVVWEGKKLGGILCESGFLGNRPEYAILGVGLNVDHELDDFPEDLRGLAVSIRMACRRQADGGRGPGHCPGIHFRREGSSLDGAALLRRLLPEIGRWREIFETSGGGAAIIEEFERNSIYRNGDPLAVAGEEGLVQGLYRGIDPDGALRMLVANDIRRFSSAEIVRILQ